MLLAGLAFVVVGPAGTNNDMHGSAHDFSSNGEELCLYCHTSMSPSPGTAPPLWDREISDRSFTMYKSATMDMKVETVPGEASLVCLSCHDGTMAFNPLVKNPGIQSDALMTGRAAIGADGIANDHPVAVEYDPSKDPDYAPVTNGRVGELPLYVKSGGSGRRTQVECLTCHDPHNLDNPNFLRMSNARSRLCLTCHLK